MLFRAKSGISLDLLFDNQESADKILHMQATVASKKQSEPQAQGEMMMNATYTIHDYNTGKAIGEVTMPAKTFDAYVASTGDTGAIEAREVSLMGECVWSDVGNPGDTVYLMESAVNDE